MAPFYTEFPFDRVVNVHWKKKKKDPPPDPGDHECLGGTWSFTSNDDGSLLEIHDVLSMEINGIPGDRFFGSPPPFSYFRVVPNLVEFGRIEQTIPEKNLWGGGLYRPGSVLLIEGETVPGGGSSGPPPTPPAEQWPGGWLPKYSGGTPSIPTLSFSAQRQPSIMPAYPDEPFMYRSGGWSYTYSLFGPGPPSYPCFDPDIAPGLGVFYLTATPGTPPGFSGPYQEWWDYHYGGGGGADPGYYGDQFYDNVGPTTTVGVFRLKLTQICGPDPHVIM